MLNCLFFVFLPIWLSSCCTTLFFVIFCVASRQIHYVKRQHVIHVHIAISFCDFNIGEFSKKLPITNKSSCNDAWLQHASFKIALLLFLRYVDGVSESTSSAAVVLCTEDHVLLVVSWLFHDVGDTLFHLQGVLTGRKIRHPTERERCPRKKEWRPSKRGRRPTKREGSNQERKTSNETREDVQQREKDIQPRDNDVQPREEDIQQQNQTLHVYRRYNYEYLHDCLC